MTADDIDPGHEIIDEDEHQLRHAVQLLGAQLHEAAHEACAAYAASDCGAAAQEALGVALARATLGMMPMCSEEATRRGCRIHGVLRDTVISEALLRVGVRLLVAQGVRTVRCADLSVPGHLN